MTPSKRIQYHEYGGPEVLRFEDFQPPRPGPGQVLIRVKAAAANPMDRKIRNGEMKILTGRKFPRGLGHDFAGVVAAVGDGVTRLGVGDEVLGGASLKAAGAFAEMVVAEEKAVVTKPANLSWEEAATIPVVGLTAFQAVVNTGKGSCRETATREARDLGITPIVDFDFGAAKLANRFDVVFDTAGTLSIGAARTLLKPGGRVGSPAVAGCAQCAAPRSDRGAHGA